MNLVLLKTRWLRWLAENLEKDQIGGMAKANCICGGAASDDETPPKEQSPHVLQDKEAEEVELAGIFPEPPSRDSPRRPDEAEEEIPEYVEYVPNLPLPCGRIDEDEISELDGAPLTLVCKRALGRLAGTDAGSGALLNLKYFEAQEDGWMMFGHAVGQEVILVKEQPLVRPATKWTRCWIDAGSAKPKDHAIYIPGCDDPEYVACGVVFVFGGDNWEKPRDDVPVAVVHKSVVMPSTLGEDIWSDVGVGSACSVKLNLVPELNTAWPSVATLMGKIPAMATPKVVLMGEPSDVSVVSETCCPNQLIVRNTFIDFPRSLDPSLVGFYHVRRTRSAPCSPTHELDEETVGQLEFNQCDLSDLVAAASAALGRTESPALEGSSKLGYSAVYFPTATFPSWPREVLFRFLQARDICRLTCACRLLSRWPKTRSWSGASARSLCSIPETFSSGGASARSSLCIVPEHDEPGVSRSPSPTYVIPPPDPPKDDILVLPPTCTGFGTGLPPVSACVTYGMLPDATSGCPNVENVQPESLAGPAVMQHAPVHHPPFQHAPVQHPLPASASYESAQDWRHPRRPCDVILQYLTPVEVCRLRTACHKLLRWSQTGLVMMVTPSWLQASAGHQLPMQLQEARSLAMTAPHSSFATCSPSAVFQSRSAESQDSVPTSQPRSCRTLRVPSCREAHLAGSAACSLASTSHSRLPAKSLEDKSVSVPRSQQVLKAAVQLAASDDGVFVSIPQQPRGPLQVAGTRRDAQHVELASCIEPPASPVEKPPGLGHSVSAMVAMVAPIAQPTTPPASSSTQPANTPPASGKHLRLAELTDVSSTGRHHPSKKHMLRRDRKQERRQNAEELKHALRASAPRRFVFPHLQNDWPPTYPPGLENLRRP